MQVNHSYCIILLEQIVYIFLFAYVGFSTFEPTQPSFFQQRMPSSNRFRNLRDRNETLRIWLDKADNDIHHLETENKNLKWQVLSLQMQLEKSQNQVIENEILLQEKDETIAEYLKEINKLDHGATSGQACPNCFKDMKQAIAEGSCWVQFEPCGHQTCYECFSDLPDLLVPNTHHPRRIRCGICGELGNPLNGLLDN